MKRSWYLVLPLVASAASLAPRTAHADAASEARVRCKASYERTQVLTRAEHFEAARAQLDTSATRRVPKC